MKPPRWTHWLRATVCGYFWMPCPLCGHGFGGHEYGATLMTSPHTGVTTCSDPACLKEASHRNKLLWETLAYAGKMSTTDAYELVRAFRPSYPLMERCTP